MVVGQWLQSACDRFVNLSGLLRWHRWIGGGFNASLLAPHLDTTAETCLKLFKVADYDRCQRSVLKKSPRDALKIRNGDISDRVRLTIEWRQLECFDVEP